MRAISVTGLPAGDTLSLWERADGLGPVGRALELAAYDGSDLEQLRAEPVGRCHARLLRLRLATLGADMDATATCPTCATRVEFSLDAAQLLLLDTDGGPGGQVSPVVAAWRPPTYADLALVDTEPDPAASLLRACVDAVDGDAAELPAEVVEAVESAMMAADPLAELLVALDCPECDARFDCSVDLADFVWVEVEARAKRILHEVDVLARAYGWTEPQVLALSDQRRASYLRLVLDGTP